MALRNDRSACGVAGAAAGCRRLRVGFGVTFDDINARADVDRGLRYDLYQVWMDVTRRGY